MLLLTHIIIALSGIAASSISYFMPCQKIFIATNVLIIGTIATGAYLTYLHPGHLLQTCLSGLIYVGAVSSVSIVARRKATHTA